jgi:flagellar basal-body rod protein FlgG
MSEVLQSLAGAMQADVAALRTISQNLANASVPAYRRQIALSATSFEELLPATAAHRTELPPAREVLAIDRTAGTLKSTGERLHLAIEGEGYFVLQSAQGVRLTRRGDFQVSAEGLLAAASGELVLGSRGPIELGTATPTVLGDATVRIGDTVIDQLQVVHAADSALQYVGNAVYAVLDAELVPIEQPNVRQGFLEAGNVTPVQEIVQMMETLRHFETAQRLLLGYDELQQRAISELGRTDQ